MHVYGDRVYVYMYVCVDVYMRICAYVCKCMYIYIYIICICTFICIEAVRRCLYKNQRAAPPSSASTA